MTPDQYRREGAEAMREAAANVCDDYPRISPGREEWELYDEQIDHSVRNIRAIDLEAVLAGLPTVAAGQFVVAVCPICDIAGGRHIRDAASAPDLCDALDAERAENERLRRALEAIIETDRVYGVTFGSGEREVWHDGDSGCIAIAALAQKGVKP